MTTIETTRRDAHRIQPLHEVQDAAKLDALFESMAAGGWTGAPVVILAAQYGDPAAITGSHRIAAAREAGVEVPTVDLADLLAEHGADLSTLIAEFTAAGLNDEEAVYEVIVRLADHLPAEVIDHYGLDAH